MDAFTKSPVGITAVKVLFGRYNGCVLYMDRGEEPNEFKTLLFTNSILKNKRVEEISLSQGVEIDEAEKTICIASKKIKFLCTTDYLTWREYFLWVGHPDGVFKIKCAYKGSYAKAFILYSGVFELHKWKCKVKRNNLISDPPQPIQSSNSHCRTREYFNLQWYLQNNWNKEISQLEEVKKDEVFQVVLMDKFYRYKGSNYSGRNTCTWKENKKCLCVATTIDSELAYINTSTPFNYLHAKKKILRELCSDASIIEKYFALYLGRYPELNERLDLFSHLLGRAEWLLTHLYSRETDRKKIKEVPEDVLLKYLSDRAGVVLHKISNAHSSHINAMLIPNQNNLNQRSNTVPQPAEKKTIKMGEAEYELEFCVDVASNIFFMFYEMYKQLLVKNNIGAADTHTFSLYLVQLHHLSKCILIEKEVKIEEYAIEYIQTKEEVIKEMLSASADGNASFSRQRSFFSLFAFSVYLCTYLGYSFPALISVALKFSGGAEDPLSSFYTLAYIRRMFCSCKRIFPEDKTAKYFTSKKNANTTQGSLLSGKYCTSTYNELKSIMCVLGLKYRRHKKKTVLKMLLRHRPSTIFFKEWFYFILPLLREDKTDKHTLRFHQHMGSTLIYMEESKLKSSAYIEIEDEYRKYFEKVQVNRKKYSEEQDSYLLSVFTTENLLNIEKQHTSKENQIIMKKFAFLLYGYILMVEYVSWLMVEKGNNCRLPIYLFLNTLCKSLPFFVYFAKTQSLQVLLKYSFLADAPFSFAFHISKRIFSRVISVENSSFIRRVRKKTIYALCHIRAINIFIRKNIPPLPSEEKKLEGFSSLQDFYADLVSIAPGEEDVSFYYQILMYCHRELFAAGNLY